MSMNASRNKWLWLLAALLVLALLSGRSPAVEHNVTADDLDGESALTIWPDTGVGEGIQVNVTSGTKTTATILGVLYMDVEFEDDITQAANVGLALDGVTLRFTGNGSIYGYDDGDGGTGPTATLTLADDSGTSDAAELSFNGFLNVGTNVLITVGNGSSLSASLMTVDDIALAMPLPDNPGDLDAVASTLDIKGGSVTVESALTLTDGRVSVRDGGSLTVGRVAMQNGVNGAEIFIRDGASFQATGSTASRIADGVFHIDAGSGVIEFRGGLEVASGGTMNINRDADIAGMTISEGGTMNISGASIVGTDITVDGGALTFNSGTLGGGAFTVTGAGSEVILSGDLDPGTAMTISNGATTFSSSSATTLASLQVSGPATVNIQSTVRTDSLSVSGAAVLHIQGGLATTGGAGSFSFTGGAMNLTGGAGLDVAAVGEPLSIRGALNLYAGGASFNDDVTWTGGGSLRSQAAGATITMNGNRLTIGGGGTLDAGTANLAIAGSGGLTIQGAYIAGYDGSAVTMASNTGGGDLTLSANAQIQLTSALQRYINSSVLDLDSVVVLASDGADYTGATELVWDGASATYRYEVRQEATGWNIHVVGVDHKTGDEQYERMINAWRKNPAVGDNVGKVITPEYAQTIIQANSIATGVIGDFDSLTASGQFNAEAMAQLVNPLSTGADYDALMLYNGSELGFVNQAVINSNHNILRRLRMRNEQVRHELRITSDALCAAGAGDHSGCCLDGDKNRFWAAGYNTHENSGRGEGFNGYRYRASGLMVGYDRPIGNLVLGGAFSYVGGDFDDKSALASDSEINTYAFTAYGAYNFSNGWFVNGAIGYAYSDDKLRDYRILMRNYYDREENPHLAGWNSADFHTNSLLASVNLGYDWRVTGDLTISGSAGLAYQRAENAAHTQYFRSEDGLVGAGTLVAGSVHNHSFTVPLEVSFSYDVFGDEDQLLTIFGNAGYAYEANNEGASGRISYAGLDALGSVEIVSRQPGRHVLTLGIGGKYFYKRYEFGAGYEYVGRKRYNSHHLLGSFGVVF